MTQTRTTPWHLLLEDCSILPECRTPDMTAVIELTLSRFDLHLVLVWLQKLEGELITEAFCETLRPATLSWVVVQAYGGQVVATAADTTVDLVNHWAGGFQQVWDDVMGVPFSTDTLTGELRHRQLVPDGLGRLLLQGAVQDAPGWFEGDQRALPHHIRRWERHFETSGDTLEGWAQCFRSREERPHGLETGSAPPDDP